MDSDPKFGPYIVKSISAATINVYRVYDIVGATNKAIESLDHLVRQQKCG